MDMPQNEIERMLFLERIRKTSEAAYARDSSDVDNLTRWGTALLELASFFPIAKAKTMIQDAMLKLEEALKINSKNSLVLCQLGNAYSSFGLVTCDAEEARFYFNKASDYLKRACVEEPDNELYSNSLAMAAKAPEFHYEFQQQHQAAAAAAEASSSSSAKKKERSSDLKYDITGWVILAVGLVAITIYTQNHVPPPEPPRYG